MNGRVATVLGVGPGLGAALARRFAGEGGTALPVSADAAAFERARPDLGDPGVLVYNAGAFEMGGVLGVSPSRFDACFRVNGAG